ncbi:AMP-binding protein [Pseudomonas sp. NPDC089752]|uniref:AMP-binding protein n=1 Tax=Pseudomonas sp. NPDC089752 TaxID=3364472 RepID=UPI0037F5E379
MQLEHSSLGGVERSLVLGHLSVEDPSVFNIAEYLVISSAMSLMQLRRGITQVHRVSQLGNQRYRIQGADLSRLIVRRKPDIVEFDLAGVADAEAQAREWFRQDAQEALDIFAGDTVRHRLALLPGGRLFWGILAHHAATDNFGIKQFIDDVLSACRGDPLSVAQAERRTFATTADADTYWLQRMDGFLHHLPDVSTRAQLPGRGLKVAGALRSPRGEPRWRVRQEDYLRAMLAAVLIECRALGSSAGAVNLPVSTRHLDGQVAYGLAMSVLPLMFSINPQASVGQNLQRLCWQLDEQSPYYAVDLANSPMDSKCRKWLAGLPAINLVHTDSEWTLGDWQLSRHYIASGAVQNYNITVRFGAEPVVEVDVHEQLYDLADAQALLQCFTDAFNWLGAEPAAPLQAYFAQFATPPASSLLLALQPQDRTAIRWRAEPDAAVPGQDCALLTMNYETLTQKVAKIAQQLMCIMPSNQRFAILLPRGLDGVLSTLAVHEAGATFVPVNVNLATDDLVELLHTLDIAVVITDVPGVARLPGGTRVRVITLESLEHRRLPGGNRYTTASDAYIFRSSGTTGRPKFIPISRDGLGHYLQAMTRRYELRQDDVLLNLSLSNFDAWIEEVFGWVHLGGCLAIAPAETVLDHALLLEFCHQAEVSVFNFATNYWHQLVFFHSSPIRQRCPSARLAIIGGDLAQDSAIRQWLHQVGKGIRLINSYGPTEACVVATAMLIDQDFVPGNLVGAPLENTDLVIKAPGSGQILAAGREGEVCLRGPSLTPGYLAIEVEDASRLMTLEDGHQYWRTGDRGLLDEHGRLFFIGRMDATAKFESEQVDLHMLERLLASRFSTFLAKASVSASQRGHKFIDIQLHGDACHTDKSRVVDYLRGTFPKLKAPFVVSLPNSLSPSLSSGTAATADNIPPEAGLLLEVWQRVLGDGVGIITWSSDFYALSGTSLQALMIVNLCAEAFGVHLKMKHFYADPKPAGLWRAIKANSRMTDQLPERIEPGTSDQLMWIMESLVEGTARHNLALVHDLRGRLDIARLEACFLQLLSQSPALCQVARLEQGTLHLSPAPADLYPLAWRVQSVREPLALRQERALNKAVECFITQTFELTEQLPVRLCVVDYGEQQYKLMLCVHHGFCDGVSAGLLLAQLSRLYNGETQAPAAEHINPGHKPPAGPEALAYWAEALLPHCTRIAESAQSTIDGAFDGRRLSFALDENALALFSALQRRANLTLDQVILTLYCQVLESTVGEQNLIIGMPSANRNGAGSWQQLGSFACTALLALEMTEFHDAAALARHLRRKLLEFHDHPGVSVAELRGYLREHFAVMLPEPRFFFVSQPDAGAALALRGIEARLQPPERIQAKGEIALELVSIAGRQHLQWLYDSSLYAVPMVQALHAALLNCACDWLNIEGPLPGEAASQTSAQVTV